jgi:hypothetical protein
MWITDKFGHPINTHWLIGLYVDSDGGTGYEVKGNSYDPTSGAGILAAQFTNGTTMTEPEAQALLVKISDLLGSFDPTS